MQKTILILGATGLLGEPVARRLKADGFQVRILARNVAKAREHFDEGFEIVEGDATNAADIKRAMDGCYGVHLSLAGDAERIGAELVAAAAAEQGIERISYISGCTAVEENRWFPLTDDKLRAEAAIRDSGVAYTIFAPTYPMEMLPRYARDGQPTLLGKSDRPYSWFAADDLARMVSTAYTMDEAANKRLVVHGPEALSMPDALMRYCRVFHPEVDKISFFPLWLANLIGTLTNNELLKFGAAITGYLYKVGEMGDPTEANDLLGAPATTLDEWLEKRKA